MSSQVIREPQEFRDSAKDLSELLDIQFDLNAIIPEKLQSNSVRKCLKNMMDVIEEALKFIEARLSTSKYSLGKLCNFIKHGYL